MAGYLAFATGQVLTAAQVNGFLMEQSVMRFADDAARTTALSAVLAEGMLTYNEDTAALERYDGSAWVPAAPVIPGIGSNVVQTVKTNTFSTASATFVTVTGLTATITPTSASSKILIIAQVAYSSPDDTTTVTYKVTRGGTDIYRGDAEAGRTQGVFGGQTTASVGNLVPSGSIVYLDSPGVATATTYQVEMAATTGTCFVNRGRAPSASAAHTNAASSITVIEVAP